MEKRWRGSRVTVNVTHLKSCASIMNKNSSGFIHSIKVPRLYKTASIIVKKVVEEGGSLKDLVYSSGHKNIKGVYALVVETIKHANELDRLIKNSKLLKKETRLQPWLARILITELIFGKKELKGDSKPVQTVLSYKEQFEKLLKNYTAKGIKATVKKPRYVRVNTLHHTPDEIIKIFRNDGWKFIPTPEEYSEFLVQISNLSDDSFTKDFHIKELLVFSGNVQFYENELYRNGSILLQDKASCLPAFLLKPSPNSIALDMCAAPGMKTTHLSALMRNKGQVYATELDQNRYKVLCDVITNAGCSNVTPLNMDALKLCQNNEEQDLSWCKDVEYILVDPSCSGSGIIERINIFAEEKTDPQRLKKLCRFQFKLLHYSLTMFPKVKRVVYSTCSIQQQENENVVESVLSKLNNLEGEESSVGVDRSWQPKFRLAEPLKESWPRRGADDFECGKFCIFSDPKKDLTNGFFIAVFERVEDEPVGLELSKNDEKTGKRKMKDDAEVFKQNESLDLVGNSMKKKKKKDKIETQDYGSDYKENEKDISEKGADASAKETEETQETLNFAEKKKKNKKNKERENGSAGNYYNNDEGCNNLEGIVELSNTKTNKINHCEETDLVENERVKTKKKKRKKDKMHTADTLNNDKHYKKISYAEGDEDTSNEKTQETNNSEERDLVESKKKKKKRKNDDKLEIQSLGIVINGNVEKEPLPAKKKKKHKHDS